MSTKRISFISGPGHHADAIYKALIQNKNNTVSYFKYYPKYRKLSEKGRSGNHFFDFITYVIWGISNRLNLDVKRAELLVFRYYDHLCSRNINSNTDILIAWPQVSTKSIAKAKKLDIPVLLEFPMIHPIEWNALMRKEYKKHHIPQKLWQNMFDMRHMGRILQEIELSDRVNVLSSFAKNTFIKYGVSEAKLSVIGPSASAKRKHTNRTKKESKKAIILFVGRVDLLKGVPYLLQAFHGIKTEAELWLAGTVSKEIQPVLKKYHHPNIKYLGFQERKELDGLYSDASVLVLPSVQESYGLVILEALANQTPVIASKNSGAPDMKKHMKTERIALYDFDDVSQLANLIEAHLRQVSIRDTLPTGMDNENYQQEYNDLVNSML